MTLLWIEIRWKQDNLFLPQFRSLFQAFRSWGQRKEMWAKKKNKQRRGGVGLRTREVGVPFSLPLSLLFVSFSLSSFAPHSTIRTPGTGYNFRRDASAPSPQVETLFLTGFDPVWPKPACAYRTSPIATGCKRPDVVCLRKVKETRGHARRLQRAS